MQFKLNDREINTGIKWLPLLLIIVLPVGLIYFTPLPEDFSRFIASIGLSIGIIILPLVIAIRLNPKPMTELQRQHITIEKYKKGNRLKRILQLIFLIGALFYCWGSVIPASSDAYHYIKSGTVLYVKGRVALIESTPFATYFFDEGIYIHDNEGLSHHYTINYSLDTIVEDQCIEFYALPKSGIILSFHKIQDSGACGFEIKTMTDPI